MIYFEDAPALESELHKIFDAKRINHVNRRREYFRVSLSEIEVAVWANHGEIEFVQVPEASGYWESLLIAKNMK